MKQYLIRNKTDSNVTASVLVEPYDNLGNTGHDMAVTITDGKLDICLAPTSVAIAAASVSKTECFELNDASLYAVEINGELVPYAFHANQLPLYFDENNPSKVLFGECKEPLVPGSEYMLLGAGLTSELVIGAENELIVIRPDGGTVPGTISNAAGKSYYVYSINTNDRYQAQLDYLVKPKVPGEKIKGLLLNGFTEVKEWCESGYDGFYPGMSLGTYMNTIPDYAPINTTNLDNLVNPYMAYFRQDLSNWDVKKIPERPAGWTYEENFPGREPIWGTAPEPTIIIPDIAIPTGAMVVRGIATQNNGFVSISSMSPLNVVWRGKLIPRRTLSESESKGFTYNYYLDNEIVLSHPNESLYIWHTDGVSPIDEIDISGMYEIEDWYNRGYVKMVKPGLSLGEYIVRVPEYSPVAEDHSHMFGSYFNDARIVDWDASRLIKLNDFLYKAMYFSHNLSNWCVSSVFSRPNNFWPAFQNNESQLLAREPVWGTCPLDPNNVRYWPTDADLGSGSYAKIVVPPGEKVTLSHLMAQSRTNIYAKVIQRIITPTATYTGVNSSGTPNFTWKVSQSVLSPLTGVAALSDASKYNLSNTSGWYSFGYGYQNNSDVTVTIELISESAADFRVAAELVMPVDIPAGDGKSIVINPEDKLWILVAYETSGTSYITDTALISVESNGTKNTEELTLLKMENFGSLLIPPEPIDQDESRQLGPEYASLFDLTTDQLYNDETGTGYSIGCLGLTNKVAAPTTFTYKNGPTSSFRIAIAKNL